MRTAFARLIAVVFVAALTASVCAEQPASQPASQPAPKDNPTAVDRVIAQRLDAQLALTQADAQRKALDFIAAPKAHQEALATLEQCRACHQPSGTVPELSQRLLRVSLRAEDTPWVGVSVGPADDVLRSQLKLPEGTGVVVTQVVPDGPAQKADVREHDILISVNGQPIPTGDALDELVKSAKPDVAPLDLKLLREGQAVDRQVTPARQAPQALSVLSRAWAAGPSYRIGVSVSEPDETLRKQLKLGEGGLVVTAVADDGPAAKQGVKVNDVILSANGRAVKEGPELTEAVRQAAESPVELELLRGGVRLKVSVAPEKDESSAVHKLLSLEGDAMKLQELTLVHPGVLDRDHLDIAGWIDLAHPHTQPSGSPADRLDRITAQLDQLRATVESMKASVESMKAEVKKPEVKEPK